MKEYMNYKRAPFISLNQSPSAYPRAYIPLSSIFSKATKPSLTHTKGAYIMLLQVLALPIFSHSHITK